MRLETLRKPFLDLSQQEALDLLREIGVQRTRPPTNPKHPKVRQTKKSIKKVMDKAKKLNAADLRALINKIGG